MNRKDIQRKGCVGGTIFKAQNGYTEKTFPSSCGLMNGCK